MNGLEEENVDMAELEKFDYTAAVTELQGMVAKVEDPSTCLDDIDKYIKRSEDLIKKCRSYLRTAREKVDTIEEI